MVVYNVVDMKRRGSPAIKYGSSGSVTETGAQQGKSSSTVTIRQTEENGQEKSSGRASVENVGKIERRSPPSFNGSSNSVDETGARRGKSSSTVTIRQTEGNSQEKSSGRARDTAARRRMSAEERKNTPPMRKRTGIFGGTTSNTLTMRHGTRRKRRCTIAWSARGKHST